MTPSYRTWLDWRSYYIILFCGIVAIQNGNCETTVAPGESDEGALSETMDWHKSVCLDFSGAYVRKSDLGIICCGNQTLLQPMSMVENWDTNLQLEQCTDHFEDYKEMDLPTALWNVSLCVLRNSSAFPDGKVTFDNYFKYITSAYPAEIKAKMETSVKTCKADADKGTDDVAKLRKFTECFHKSEKEACHVPYKEPFITLNKTDGKHECPEMVGIYGLDRFDYCCKEQSIPYNFLEFYIKFPMEEIHREQVDNCSTTFTNKQLELDPKLKAAIEKYDNDFDAAMESINGTAEIEEKKNPREDLYDCTMACEVRRKNYVDAKDLNVSYDSVITSMTSEFGKKIQTELKKILTTRKSEFRLKYGDKTLKYKELETTFKSADELSKMKLYCSFAKSVVGEVERSLHEYCFDKEFADKWFVDNHL